MSAQANTNQPQPTKEEATEAEAVDVENKKEEEEEEEEAEETAYMPLFLDSLARLTEYFTAIRPDKIPANLTPKQAKEWTPPKEQSKAEHDAFWRGVFDGVRREVRTHPHPRSESPSHSHPSADKTNGPDNTTTTSKTAKSDSKSKSKSKSKSPPSGSSSSSSSTGPPPIPEIVLRSRGPIFDPPHRRLGVFFLDAALGKSCPCCLDLNWPDIEITIDEVEGENETGGRGDQDGDETQREQGITFDVLLDALCAALHGRVGDGEGEGDTKEVLPVVGNKDDKLVMTGLNYMLGSEGLLGGEIYIYVDGLTKQ